MLECSVVYRTTLSVCVCVRERDRQTDRVVSSSVERQLDVQADSFLSLKVHNLNVCMHVSRRHLCFVTRSGVAQVRIIQHQKI